MYLLNELLFFSEQATPPVNIPGSTKFTPNGNSFSISWQSPPVTFTGIPVSGLKTQQINIGRFSL